MVERQVYLHCGASKTGTTAQQRWLAGHTDELISAGLAYFTTVANEGSTSHRLPNALVRSPFQRSLADHLLILRQRAMFTDRLDREMIVSSESLASLRAVKGMTHVARFFRRLGFKTRSVLFIRNQVDQLSSHYAQRARSLRSLGNFSEHLTHDHLQQVDWHVHYVTHQQVGFDPNFGVYRGREGRPVAEVLMTLFGLRDRFPPNVDFSSGEANPSVGEITVLAGVTMARHLKRRGVHLRARQQDEIRRHFTAASALVPESKFIGPNAEDRVRIRSHFLDSNRKMAQVLTTDDYEALQVERLSNDFPTSPRSWEQMTEMQREMFDTVLTDVQARIRANPLHATLFPNALLNEKLRPD